MTMQLRNLQAKGTFDEGRQEQAKRIARGDDRVEVSDMAALRAEAPAPALVALVREWQEARKPAKLAEPGVNLAATYQAAVKRMVAADEALAAYDLNGPAGGALAGQTEPTESTGPYPCACTCGCVGLASMDGRCMACRRRESCRDLMTCEACAAGYRLASDGIHYDHNDSTWGVCRKVIAQIRMDRQSKRERSEAP